MNRAILILILSGTSILVAHLFFFFLPISVFPCTLTPFDHASIQSMCSVAEVSQPPDAGHFTGYGELVHFLLTWIAPIIVSIGIVLSTSKRSQSRKRSNIEQLP